MKQFRTSPISCDMGSILGCVKFSSKFVSAHFILHHNKDLSRAAAIKVVQLEIISNERTVFASKKWNRLGHCTESRTLGCFIEMLQ